MAGKTGLIALIVGIIVVVGAVASYIHYHSLSKTATSPTPIAATSTASQSETRVTSTSMETATAKTTNTEHGTQTTSTSATQQNVIEISPRVAAACRNIGNGKSIDQNIKWLFDHHSEFSFIYHEYPENKTIIWIIKGPNKESLETLVTHIEQMECVIEHGGNPRPFDPLFKVDAEISAKYVHTEIKWLNDTAIEVIKKADNDCAWLVIKLHAEVVKGFFTTGRIEAQKIHEVPQEALEVCKPYLESSS